MSRANMPKLSAYSDCEVIRALYGNLEELESFHEKVTRDISRNLLRNTPDHEAEELALEVIEKMCRHRRDTKFRDHPGNYTKRIIFGTIIDHWRSTRANKYSACDDQCNGSSNGEGADSSFQFGGRRQRLSIEELDLLSEETMDGVAPHDLEVEQAELISILNSVLDGLGDYGEALRYCYIYGFSYAETAELMGKEVTTIKILLHRGKKSLRHELIRAGYTEHDLGVTRKKDNGKVKKK